MYLNNLDMKELQEIIMKNGFPKFRSVQLFRWIHKNLEDNFNQMHNLPKDLLDYLNNEYAIDKMTIYERFNSIEDETKKYLFRLSDGNIIESVYLKYHFGESACISSQVGCAMGCSFCASTKNGKLRDLRASEMLGQVYEIQKDLGISINSIVVMGSGEPFDNYENLKKFIEIITSPEGKNLSIRKITVSTCGLIPFIYRAADENIGFNLAISLHAANQTKREKLIPIARKYSVSDLVKSCRYYTEKTGRRITYEYVMIHNVNDSLQDAEDLVSLLKNSICLVNLIPLNHVTEFEGTHSTSKSITMFYNHIKKNKINVTIRRELGKDINAACGQLRNQSMGNQ